ncbi:nucleoside deaminase [Dysgonomonas sp. 521]|uniref:nucleoside deaminase n=1 Tax=Dysgonomonas sp. 521 TaxID=2302932 RepID=UPI0013D136F4|nr:nucleoside deaminase [Dysgonomonas sp. 521]NDV96783.1 nucleoside deaminase [Dysgonomonas sp. 521]
MERDIAIMKIVLNKARESLLSAESPFAAAITLNDEIVTLEGNNTKKTGNPLLHAEIMSIQNFCEHFGNDKFADATIYCSCEPCIMCFSAIQTVGIKNIVFGANISDAIKFNSGDINVTIKKLNVDLGLGVNIKEHVLRNDFVHLFEEFTDKYGDL